MSRSQSSDLVNLDAAPVLMSVDDSISNLPHVLAIADISTKIVEMRSQVTTHRRLSYQVFDRVAACTAALLAACKEAKQRGEVKVDTLEKELQSYKELLEDIHHDVHSLLLARRPRLMLTFKKSDGMKGKLQTILRRLTEFAKVFEVMGASDPFPESASTSQHVSRSASVAERTVSATILANLPSVLKDISESLQGVPYVKSIASVCIQILEIREQIKDNKDLFERLIDHVADRSTVLLRSLQRMRDNSQIQWEDLKYDLARYEKLLVDIHGALAALIPSRVSSVFSRDAIKNELLNYSARLTQFDATFNFSRLTNIEMIVRRIDAHGHTSRPAVIRKAASIPPPSRIFTGRQQVLTMMAQYFDPAAPSILANEQRIYVLYGLGGAGKTQIGLKFITEHGNQFSRTYFINASTVESITTAFENIGHGAGLTEPTMAETLDWLSFAKEEWLLFFDNADDPSVDLYSYFPHCAHGSILVTSRNPEMRQLAPHSHHQVGVLDQEEALQLLQSSSMRKPSGDDEGHAKMLIQELGYLALAIVQAGAYIAKSPTMAFKRYRDMYKAHRADLLQRKTGQSSDSYEWTVYTTWEISFQKLSSLAADLLQLFSFWHYDRIPKVVFQNALLWHSDFPDDWNDAATLVQNFANSAGEWDDFAFQQVVNELVSFSLLSFDLEDIYTMHPLVHSWARDRSSSNDQQRYNLCAGRLLGLSIPGLNIIEPQFLRLIIIHVQAWIVNQSEWIVSADPDLANQFVDVYLGNGWWKEAEELEVPLIETQRKTLGEEHPDTLASKRILAFLWSKQGRWKEAEEMQTALLNTSRKILGEEDPISITIMSDLAGTYGAQGRWEEAEELQLAVLEKWSEVLGEEDQNVLANKGNLARIYSEQGKWKQAEEFQTTVLDVQKRVLGEEHDDTLTTMMNLASTYLNQGRWQEAEKLSSAVLERWSKDLGDEHPVTLTTMANLAYIYSKQGRWTKAEELQSAVLDAQRKVLGEEHPETLLNAANLALTYTDQGKLTEAEKLQATILATQRRVLGEEHPHTLLNMGNLALTYSYQKKWHKAEEIQLAVLEIQKRVVGEEHYQTLVTMANLASTYTEQGRWKEATDLTIAVLEARKRILGPEHPQTLTSLGNLAWLNSKMGRWKDAVELEIVVLEKRKQVLGEDHPQTRLSEINLAEYQEQSRVSQDKGQS